MTPGTRTSCSQRGQAPSIYWRSFSKTPGTEQGLLPERGPCSGRGGGRKVLDHSSPGPQTARRRQLSELLGQLLSPAGRSRAKGNLCIFTRRGHGSLRPPGQEGSGIPSRTLAERWCAARLGRGIKAADARRRGQPATALLSASLGN